jgi:sodium/bile acid cotransporter 7
MPDKQTHWKFPSGKSVHCCKRMLRLAGQGPILLVVYTAFCKAVIHGLWRKLPVTASAGLGVSNLALPSLAIAISTFVSRRLGFSVKTLSPCCSVD